MEKGKFGINLSFYAVVAFLLVIIGGYSLPLFLIAGVVIFAEKNEWASRQVIQAICLQIVSGIIFAALDIFDFFYKIPIFGAVWGVIISVISSIIGIAILVFAIIAIVNVAKGKEANIPLANKFADWAYGKVVAKVQPVYQQPAAPAQPVAPAQPAAPADVCANCGAPLNGGAFCTKCGTPAAK